VNIMAERAATKLDRTKRFLLSAAGLLALAAPVVFGVVHATVSQAQSPPKSTTSDLSGTWQGTLQAGRGLRAVIKISKADGQLKAIFYSIDQGGQPIPVTSIALEKSAVNFSIQGLDVTYLGTLNPDGNSIAGSFTQNGQAHALNLERVAEEDAWPIPASLQPMAADANPEFEVVTIKASDPNNRTVKQFRRYGRHVFTINTNVNDLITYAYGLHEKQIVGGPAWLNIDKFDIDGVPDVEGGADYRQGKGMLQKLLADRFKLTFHRDKQELSVYALVVGKDGPKLTQDTGGPRGVPGSNFNRPGVAGVRNGTMGDFASWMQDYVLDRPVVDQTGLKGTFDFELKWTPDESQYGGRGIRVPPPADNADAPPDLFTAIQEQLGLKLDATKASVNVLVIDHVEKPSPN
jgi:uncharacterized protein (TIGR03435 family)